MPKVIMIANQKGGVCKTTTSCAISYTLHSWGHPTLVIDADHQQNTSDTYQVSSEGVATIYDLILSDEPCSIREAIQHTEYGDIIAGDADLVFADRKITDEEGYFRLRKAMESLTDYEYVVIDSRPDLDAVLMNLLVATDMVVIPVKCAERFSIKGLDMFMGVIKNVQARYNPDLKLEGLLVCDYNGRQRYDRNFMEQFPVIAANAGMRVFDTVIRHNIACRDAQTSRVPLKVYDPKCKAQKDYEAFTRELLGIKEA